MPTRGQARYFRSNINSYIAFVFIGVYALGVGLVLWHAAFGNNPIADLLVKENMLDTGTAHAMQK